MKAHEHIKFNGALLDNVLAQGCYRMRQDIFTTHFVWNGGNFYNVFWLRYPLDKFYFDKKPLKLLHANAGFNIAIQPFLITKEIEELYQTYFDNTDFDAPPTVQDFLFGETEATNNNLFESEMIEVKDGNRLIAVGIYDKGLNSMAGIMNFYDPAYKKYSLGKYLMLLKIKHAVKEQMQFYYPGYIALDFNKFDYKLFPNAALAEIFYARKKIWLPYSNQLLFQLKNNMHT